MVQSALNFNAGFWGLPFEDQYHQMYMVEAPGYNNTLSPHFTCPNDGTRIMTLGYIAAANWTSLYLQEAVERLNQKVKQWLYSYIDLGMRIS